MSTRRASNSNTSAPRYSADYASDRSPLQKVETIVGGMSKEMSKEEKRARIQEMEDRIAAGRGQLPVQYNEASRPKPSQTRYDAGSYFPNDAAEEAHMRPSRTTSNRTDYNSNPVSMRAGNGPADAMADAKATHQARAALYNQGQPTQAGQPAHDYIPMRNDGRRRSDGYSPRVLTKPAPPTDARAVSDSYGQPPARQRSVREGRVFDTDPGYAEQNYNEGPVQPVRASRDFATRDGNYTQPLNSPTTAPQPTGLKSRIGSLFKRKRDSRPPPKEYDTESPSPPPNYPTSGFYGNSQDSLRRYQEPQYNDYRKNMRVARVGLEEPLAAAASPATPSGTDKTWWEKGQTSAPLSKRRVSGGYEPQSRSANVDGGNEPRQAPGAQTYFQPQLYLKCGPLLRFTGIRKSSRRSAQTGSARVDKEVWTGSVMIVTVDSKSMTQTPPNLRIFKQPVDLLPPPPHEINEVSGQQLSPEYVDPIAGQVKMSRVGKTLYVKPVEALEEHRDLSRVEDDSGLFEEFRSAPYQLPSTKGTTGGLRAVGQDGELRGKFQDIPAYVLHQERGVTFWRWNLEIELNDKQVRIAYRINRGPAIGFWVPAKGEMMNIMFHSCNGFSLSVDPNAFSGPDPLWRDVLNSHQTRPFHVMLGGGDQIYNDAATKQTKLFAAWSASRNAHHKHNTSFTAEMQAEMETFYLNRYAMWFSQGLFGMANSQIPMVNIWDDHDIIDGFGSYPDHTMASPVMSGVGNVAFKYYMLFQHQALPIEDEQSEPSWLLGAERGPYINELSRSLFMWLGRQTAFLGLDCRTERMRDEIMTQETWDLIFNRLRKELVKGSTQHLIVLLGVPIAYPRLNFLENVLTSRVMDPVKALGRTGALGGFVNKFDGGVEILDDLDDHWTAKHHKAERNWFIQELQGIAAEKSVRVTILGGDVHLGAVGQFYSKKALGLPKDQDHRYMPNVISSAIVNTPPSDMVADVLNKRNKVHHMDEDTDEDMIAMFPADVNNKPRNNHHLLPRRNWCSIKEYKPELTPPPTPSPPGTPTDDGRPAYPKRTLSFGRSSSLRPGNLMRRLSSGARRNSLSGSSRPPISYPQQQMNGQDNYRRHSTDQPRRASADINRGGSPLRASEGDLSRDPDARPNPFQRRPTVWLPHNPTHMINLRKALDIRLNCENEQGDPAGTTTEYRLLVPALDYRGDGDPNPSQATKQKGRLSRWLGGGGIQQREYGSSQESFDDQSAGHRTHISVPQEPQIPVVRRRRDSMSPPDGPSVGADRPPAATSTAVHAPQQQYLSPNMPVRTRPISLAQQNMVLPGPPPGPPPSMRVQQPAMVQLPGPPPGPPPNMRRNDVPPPAMQQQVVSDPRVQSGSDGRRASADIRRGAKGDYV